MYFVQCASCRSPVGVTEYFSNDAILDRINDLEKEVKAIASQLSSISHALNHVVSSVRRP
jgi:hypothetical protein